MRLSWWLLPVFAIVLDAAAAPPVLRTVDLLKRDVLAQRDGHAHSHHGTVLNELNETEILGDHSPTPPSYWSIDFQDNTPDRKRYPGLMGLHVLFMSFAFFGALPIGIALRSVKHPCHPLSVVVFYVFVALGLSSSALYRKLTPDMYEHSAVHGTHGYFVLLLAGLLSTLDLFALFARLVSYVRSVRSHDIIFTFSSFWHVALLGNDDSQHLSGSNAEYTNLVVEDPEEYEEQELKAVSGTKIDEMMEPIHTRRSRPIVAAIKTVSSEENTAQWIQSATSDRTLFGNSRHGSVHSDDTLPDITAHIPEYRSWYRKVRTAVFATLERVLVFAGFFQLLTGIVVYTGGCRETFINGCLAHLIKGGIFWCYGLVSFSRFLGSFSEMGWAWNRIPVNHRKNVPSAEFVESFVIFLYGITNTWMERFGADPGDPYTTKQVQHISIAVMFWFAGLIGMGLESKTFRRWLAAGSLASQYNAVRPQTLGTQKSVAEPPSYVASFNPFPALCIGILGTAMAAHYQRYLFQVQIHALWGNMLTAFAVLRCFTYFFLWLGPPRSTLPSRPPTEALASFFLTCGGLVFMFSTEEVTIAAMRRGHDDVMMFLNLAVAITCLAFCWCMAIVSFKGWLKSRTIPRIKFHSSA